MAKSIFEELTSYRVKIERDGKEIVNVPGILVLPIALAAPKASIIGTIAAPILGCSIHVENENGNEIDVGKAVKAAADTVIDTAKTAAKTIKEEVDKAWDELSADDPEGCPEGTEKDEESGDGKDAEDDIPTIQINPDDSEKE
ncbi:MAG: DUF4342 domain-containing protein [Clostridia bacterium]|nr:DUF4342 domain-containing protein [Clostridia bacterium]